MWSALDTFGVFAVLSGSALCQTLAIPANLVGTWSTKNNKTLTGPGFYNSAADQLIEPSRTGISYSFTANGYYEEAYYRAIPNPQNPACPGGIMQWQHGSFTYNADGSLSLSPIATDGRQLLSKPCDADTAIYTRYNQTETFKSFQQYTDPYHNVPRLDLFGFDGTPMNPMYLIYTVPDILPTTTLHPSAPKSSASATAGSKLRKRSPGMNEMNAQLKAHMATTLQSSAMDPDRWWWVGLTLTGVGGLLYFGPRRMGLTI